MVKAMGVKVLTCDGNDVVRVYKLLSKAKKEIKQGKGPYFLEFFTYRWLEHCGPNFDNNLGYRTEKEFQKWKKKEPIKRLVKKFDFTFHKKLKNIHIETKEEIDKAFKFAEKSQFPKQSEAHKGVYAQN